MPGLFRLLCVLLMVAITSLICPAQVPQDPLNVLLVYPEERAHPAFLQVDAAFRATVQQGTPRHVEFFNEYLEFSRFSEPGYEEVVHDYLVKKYATRKIALVLAVANDTISFLYRQRSTLLAECPRVFSCVSPQCWEKLGPFERTTGVFMQADFAATLEAALTLQPRARRVVVIVGAGSFDKPYEAQARHDLRTFGTRVALDYWVGRSLTDLQRDVAALPADDIVFYLCMTRDSSGNTYVSARVAEELGRCSPAPVYGCAGTWVGHGIVGGRVIDFPEQGRVAGNMALRMLAGDSPQAIPIVANANLLVFDGPSLHKWGLSQNLLPANSAVWNPVPFWKVYRLQIVGAILLPLAQGLLIGLLLRERKRRRSTEAVVVEGDERLKLAVASATLGLWSWSPASGALEWNDHCHALFGISPETKFGFAESLAMVHEEDRERVRTIFAQALAEHTEYDVQYRITRPDGGERWIASRGRCQLDAQGSSKLLGVLLDLTEIHQANERFRLAVELFPTAVIMSDAEGRIVLLSKQTEKIFGYSRQELIGLSIEELIPDMAAPCASPMFGRRKDGTELQIEVGLSPIETPQGLFVLSAILDISDKMQAQAEARQHLSHLAHMERVSSLGQLAASIAHELNQPLTAIKTNAQAAHRLIRAGKADPAELAEILLDIAEDTTRAGKVIRRVRSLARNDEVRLSQVELASAMSEMMEFMSAEANLRGAQIEVQSDLAEVQVLADRTQLQQVLLNLLMNALEAMQDTPPDRRLVGVSLRPNGPEGMVLMAVEDRGVGIEPERLEEIFEPFQTSKPNGMGIGLSICRSIIEAHGGRLWAENNAQGGATFLFTLPAGPAS